MFSFRFITFQFYKRFSFFPICIGISLKSPHVLIVHYLLYIIHKIEQTYKVILICASRYNRYKMLDVVFAQFYAMVRSRLRDDTPNLSPIQLYRQYFIVK